MKTLNKTMVQFVLEFSDPDYLETDEFSGVYYPIYEYAKFLSTPLSLGMFIPTDEDGNVLEKPKCYNNWLKGDLPSFDLMIKCKDYQKALSNVLFEGFEKCDRNLSVNCIYNKKLDLHINADFKFEKTIEDLVKYNLTLTENALK